MTLSCPQYTHRTTLPPEVIDYIIGLLCGNTYALCSCHLVCRSWVPASKYHLFHHLKLNPSNHTQSNLYSILSSETLPDLANNLTLANSMESLFHLSDFFNILIPILRHKLFHIKTLNFINFDFSRLSALSQRTLLSDFNSTLRKLSLTAVTFGRFCDLTDLILAHPELTELDLARVGWTNDSAPYYHQQNHSPRNSRLGLSNITLADLPARIVEWFTTYFSDLDIKGLVWNSTMCHSNLSALSRFLKVVGTPLERLSVSFSYDGSIKSADEFSRFNLLENLKNLRSLTLDRIFVINGNSRNYFWIPRFLRQLQSQSMEEVVFDVLWVHIDHLEAIDWNGIEHVLCQSAQLRSLKRIVLRSSLRKNDKGPKPVFEDLIRTKWSTLPGMISSIIFE